MKRSFFVIKNCLISFLLIFLSTKTVFAQLEDPIRPNNGIEGLISLIIGFLWAMAIPLGVIIVIIGAFYMATSIGKPEQFEKGKKVIFYAFIGLIVIIMAQGFIPFIRGFFN